MPTSYTSLLGLALPVTGELAGTWGDTVNDYITKYLDASVAGTQTISGSQTAVTLSVTNGTTLSQVGSGATGSAQYSIINCTGNPAGLLTVTVPAASKTYVVVNATSTNQQVKVVGAGPTTGVTLEAGEKAIIAWNGSDFIKIATSAVDGVSTISFGSTGLTPSTATSGAVTVAGTLAAGSGGTGQSTYTTGDLLYATGATALSKLGIGTNGQILTSTGTAPQWSTLSGVAVTTFSAGTTGFTPSVATSGAVTLAGTLATTNGGTGLTSFTANRVFYSSSTSAIGSSANLTFDGTTLTANALTTTSTVTLNGGTANGVAYLNGSKVLTTGSALTFDGTVLTNAQSSASGGVLANFQNSSTNSLIQFSVPGVANVRIGSPNADAIAFYTFGSGSYPEQMRLTSTGLGIGTSSPSSKLEVLVPGTTGSTSIMRLTRGVGYGTTEFKQYYTSGTDYGLTIGNTASDYLTLNLSSGNLGLGVTPSAWTSSYSALQFGLGASLAAYKSSVSNELFLSANAFENTSGNWTYIASASASQYWQNAGQHIWRTAASGTAGDPISFSQALTLDASGNLLLGGTSLYVATMTSYASSTRSGGLGIRNSAGTAAGGIFTYAAGSGGGSTDVIVESAGYLGFYAGGSTERARIPSTGGFVVGTAALATNATTGFLYVPTCAGTPTGTPATQTGTAPIVVDTTNNKLYFYSGGQWRDAGP